ncbi:MAG: glycoside hydrolase domain-containing protein [Cyanobacteria bacterium P01_C01_bin.72]
MIKLTAKFVLWLSIALSLIISLVAIKAEYSNSSSISSQTWVKNSLNHVLLRDETEKTRDIHLYAARGEYESFQIVIKGGRDDEIITDLRISPLQSQENSLIASDNITLYREHYVEITKPSPSSVRNRVKSLGKGLYPDGLIPFVDPLTQENLIGAELDAIPFTLTKNANQTIWVDIFVPRDTAAGDYRGTFTLVSDRGTVTGSIQLTVWNFELPLKPSLDSAFLSWEQHDKNTLIELLKHRVNPAANIAPEDERELIDRWGLSSIRLPFWSGANYQTCSMQPAPPAATIREAGLEHQLDLMLYVYPTDEIDDCQGLEQPFREWAKSIKQAGVKHMAVMAPLKKFFDLVDIWVVNPQRYRAAGKNIAEVRKLGKEVWFYTFFAPRDNSPTWLIDFAPINHRIAPGFINQRLGLTGLLYWRVDTWTEDPWHNVDTNPHPEKPEHYPGEGMLIYPGKQVGIQSAVPSLRLKWIRDGVEDYEYIEILKKAGYYSWAMEEVAKVAQDLSNWNQDPTILEAVRLKLGEKIDELS